MSEDGKDMYGIVWDVEEDEISGHVFVEVLVTILWKFGSETVLYPVRDYVETYYLEEVVDIWRTT